MVRARLPVMAFLFNILWLIFGGGLVIFFEYALAGILLCLTVVGIPFGLQCFKIGALGLFPFGAELTEARGTGVLSFAFNVLWFIFAGIWIFLTHLVLAVGLAVTVIGIPFALQHLKLGLLALTPFGQQVTR